MRPNHVLHVGLELLRFVRVPVTVLRAGGPAAVVIPLDRFGGFVKKDAFVPVAIIEEHEAGLDAGGLVLTETPYGIRNGDRALRGSLLPKGWRKVERLAGIE